MSIRGPSSNRQNEILVVTSAFADPEGNICHVAGELISAISMRGPFRFTWAARSGDSVPEIAGQTFLPMRGWKMIDNIPGIRSPFWNKASRESLRRAIAAADCVWLHDTLHPGAIMASRMARAMRKPVLVTQHDNPLFAAGYGGSLRRFWASTKDFLITKYLLRRAHQVTFTSDNAARFYNRRVPFKKPVKIIPLGVDRHTYRPPTTDEYKGLRAKFSLRDDQPVMLFAGRFESGSGLAVVRELARLLPKWRFWLAGQGPIKPETWYLPNIQVFRNRNADGMAELYRSADLLLLPGFDSESPRVLQEALACDLSVMCSPGVVAGGQSMPKCLVINVDPGSPSRTARAWLQKLKAGHAAWPEAGEGPFDSCWDWPQIADCYTDILATICRAA